VSEITHFSLEISYWPPEQTKGIEVGDGPLGFFMPEFFSRGTEKMPFVDVADCFDQLFEGFCVFVIKYDVIGKNEDFLFHMLFFKGDEPPYVFKGAPFLFRISDIEERLERFIKEGLSDG